MMLTDDQGYYISTPAPFMAALLSCLMMLRFERLILSAMNSVYHRANLLRV
ncbi:MAG: hypothetical protein Q4G24_10025 [Paracoccus sp. (in: a-proteobacteria)]|uniref:hypothetical protein n=1 Tax=Paracoccus sp. TaxID=267 RepID=UPI0026DECC6D|nr:hypothetical protein [Paracoccus sp. (in: a-proteobacteria)]MDO5621795.1 hypothetical protein [Paracoccus sp. (in: a-proteobacteria)]